MTETVGATGDAVRGAIGAGQAIPLHDRAAQHSSNVEPRPLEVRVAKVKTLEERLWGAAVLKMSFRLRSAEESPAFKAIYPGVLRDLDVEDAAVEQFIVANKERVEKAARGTAQE
mgnify:CR=1 FL=1